MYKHKRFLTVPILAAAILVSLFSNAFAGAEKNVSQSIKIFQDTDNPIDNSIINSNTNILSDNMDNLDNALKTIYSEPAVSDNYDKVCPLFYKSNISGIKMFVNGGLVEFAKYDNVEPVIIDGRVLVPLRAIVENLGAAVLWDESTGLIRIQLHDKLVDIYLNSPYAAVNGNQVTMDVPAAQINGRTLVPVRFIGESFSKTVEWHEFDDSLNVLAIY